MIKKIYDKEKLIELEGSRVDFYLEDDMFELEGILRNKDGKVFIEVLSAVGHILEMSGKLLEVKNKYQKFYAEKIDKSNTFEMEINRIYQLVEQPKVNELIELEKQGILQFFKKQADTFIWFDEDANEWLIELNKINMCFSGDRKSYPSIKELYEDNQEHMSGKWQAICYNTEREEERF